MARPLRIQYPGAVYHVTSRGNERKAIFKSRRDRERFIEYLQSATERYGAAIYCYCLMDNHYHLLMETPEGNLSQIMQHINGSYTTYFNVKRKRAGHLFQGRYNAILVEADSYALELSRYIHLNPVRAGTATHPEEHSWSSYVHYIDGRNQPNWLQTSPILDYLGPNKADTQRRYQEFVQDKLGDSYPSPLKMATGGAILGREAFVEKVQREHLDKTTKDRNLPALRALTRNRPMDQIIGLVEEHIEDKEMARKISIHLCHCFSGEKLRHIGEFFGLSESGVTHASRRMADEAEKSKNLGQRLREIKEKLGLYDV
jgi:REP element-mobilizing transposase RayT